TLASVNIAAGRLDRNVNVAQLFIAGQRSPSAGVAGEFPGVLARLRIFQPGFNAEFPGLRHGVERPQQFPCAHVVSADIARRVELGWQRGPDSQRGANHGDITNDDRWGRRADGPWLDYWPIQVLP